VIHLDTSFLVDLLRERRKGERRATGRLAELADAELRVSLHVLCELQAGVELSDRGDEERRAVEALVRGVDVVFPGAAFAPTYGRLLAHLQGAGTPISTMDLLIGTAAVVDGAPLLTGNPKHFRRIPGLDVLTY
jgi:tRNA(fMet)-specific endonuclease VapC